MAKKSATKAGFWNFVDSFKGDKVIWMIVLMLIMLSIIAVSSSTSLLAVQQHVTRSAIIKEQLIVSLVSLILIIGIYNIRNIKVFRALAKWGFAGSVFLLACLDLHVNLPFFKALYINSAWRIIKVFGFQLHVFEVVKIAMILYLAWAVEAYKTHNFKIANWLSTKKNFAWIGKDIWQKIIYIYAPILIVCVLIVGGSLSSALIIGATLAVVIIVGGIPVRELIPFILVGVIGLAGVIGINKLSNGKYFSHLGTAVARVFFSPEQELEEAIGTPDFQKVLDKVRQPISAKIAVSEGPKGIGKSTQKYVVPIMFEDYMFAFILEEYGLLGAIVVLLLYGSLLARGSFIVRGTPEIFAKTTVAGLTILISWQAMMHMMINVGLGPLTGQTLPMISHGKSSMIVFSIAFGIILAISRMAKESIDRATEDAAPIVSARPDDDVKAGLDELDAMDI